MNRLYIMSLALALCFGGTSLVNAQTVTKPSVGLYEFQVPNEQIQSFHNEGLHNFKESMRLERGTLSMNAAYNKENPNQFFVIEAYRDQDALAVHRQSDHFKQYVANIGSKLSDRKVYNVNAEVLLEQNDSAFVVDDRELLVNLVKVVIQPDQVDQFKRIVTAEMQDTINHEPDVLVMYAFSDANHPNEWYFYEIYRHQAAYEHHRQQSYFVDYLAKTKDMVTDKQFYPLAIDVAARQGNVKYINKGV